MPSTRTWIPVIAMAIVGSICQPARAQLVQLTELADMSFGTVASVTSDVSQSQTVCAYSGALSSSYSVRATGSGAGGAFMLSAGGSTLAYEVQWNSTPYQASGTHLTAGLAQSGFVSQGVLPGCTLGLTRSGSLTVILRAAALSVAQAGRYTGTLTVMIAPN
jgi:hypothetical protein